jgi:hypothetical protein
MYSITFINPDEKPNIKELHTLHSGWGVTHRSTVKRQVEVEEIVILYEGPTYILHQIPLPVQQRPGPIIALADDLEDMSSLLSTAELIVGTCATWKELLINAMMILEG